jgi:diphthamide biosynthesis methyltransferase
MGESGLDFYRFGQICTIPHWEKNYKPISFYETIMKNQKADQHSIVLFDYDPEKKSSMPLQDAIMELQEAEKEYIGGIGADTARVFVMYNLSAENQAKYFMTIKEAKDLKLEPGPAAIIVPARLSEVETEVIESMY